MRTPSELSLLAATLALAACASSPTSPPARSLGWQAPLGDGVVASYAEFDASGAPAAIGIVFSARALDGLPSESDNHHCVGRGDDGSMTPTTRCVHTSEHVIPLPDVASRRSDVPFKWVLLNWNAHGHIPPGIYDVPHFDVHFMMAPITDVFAIQSGGCGPERVRCDQFAIARKPVPADYLNADFRDVEAVAPAMGNHLIDVTGPEFNKQPFTRSMIYGAYDGRITFYEEMVSRAHLLAKPNACTPIKAPRAFAVAGYYPTATCVRYDAATGDYTVSMERFVARPASPAR
jgi:hypothetical protein